MIFFRFLPKKDAQKAFVSTKHLYGNNLNLNFSKTSHQYVNNTDNDFLVNPRRSDLPSRVNFSEEKPGVSKISKERMEWNP